MKHVFSADSFGVSQLNMVYTIETVISRIKKRSIIVIVVEEVFMENHGSENALLYQHDINSCNSLFSLLLVNHLVP